MASTIGALIFAIGLSKHFVQKAAIKNFWYKGCYQDSVLKTVHIDTSKNYFKFVQIYGFHDKTEFPIYVGNNIAKIPVGGSTTTEEKLYYEFLVHDLPEINTEQCKFVGIYGMSSKIYDFGTLKTKFKEQYKNLTSLSKMSDIKSNLLKVCTSNDFNVVYLIGNYDNNNQIIASHASLDKKRVIVEATNNNSLLYMAIGIVAFAIGFWYDIKYGFLSGLNYDY